MPQLAVQTRGVRHDAVELFRCRVCRQTQANAAEEVPGRNGRCGAVGGFAGGGRAGISQGRQRPAPYALNTMLRIDLMQNWFGYSDPAMEEALYEVVPLRRFAGCR